MTLREEFVAKVNELPVEDRKNFFKTVLQKPFPENQLMTDGDIPEGINDSSIAYAIVAIELVLMKDALKLMFGG